MKTIFTITIVITLVVLIYASLRPVMLTMGQCFEKEADFLEKKYVELALNKELDKEGKRQALCVDDQISYNRLNSCLTDVKKKSLIGGWVLNDFPYKRLNARVRFQEVLLIHNKVCPENPLYIDRL